MPGKIDKAILTNRGALKRKYGSKGVAHITASVGALIAADKLRRLLATERLPSSRERK